MGGVSIYQFSLSLLMIILTWFGFIALVCPFAESYWHILIALCMLWINIILMLATTFTEPGILPRSLNPTKLAELNDYCQVCMIEKDSRTKHCRYCDNCVVGFDHHCPVRTMYQ